MHRLKLIRAKTRNTSPSLPQQGQESAVRGRCTASQSVWRNGAAKRQLQLPCPAWSIYMPANSHSRTKILLVQPGFSCISSLCPVHRHNYKSSSYLICRHGHHAPARLITSSTPHRAERHQRRSHHTAGGASRADKP